MYLRTIKYGFCRYFAEDAAYSDYYASKAKWHEHTRAKGMKDDEAEMMLANLLVGNSIEIDRDKDRETQAMCMALKTPPAIADVVCASQPAEDGARVYQQQHAKQWGGTKFNTVQGYTQTDKVSFDTRTINHTLPDCSVGWYCAYAKSCSLHRH